MGGSQLVDDGFFDIPKRRFALTGEIVTDGAAEPLLNQLVRVHEGQTQPPGQVPADGGFAGAGEANEGNRFQCIG